MDKHYHNAPGWDAQAIHRVVRDHYGTLEAFFERQGWPERGQAMMVAAPTRILECWESIAAFETFHDAGALPNPLDVIGQEKPDVWLTSYYGFAPKSWGYLGFTLEWMRKRFLRESRPGALVVVYGAGSADCPAERGRVLGIQQQTHIKGFKRDFLPDWRWAEEERDPKRREKWNFGLKAARAWKVTPESRPLVRDFFPDTFAPGRATGIGAYGMRLTHAEAQRVLTLDLVEAQLFGGLPVDVELPGPAREVLKPSRAGPVSQSAFMVREAEGPKHLYILKLEGDPDALLGRSAQSRQIVKVGMSCSPETRCDAHNHALPKGAFRWRVLRSTHMEGRDPFPSSKHAIEGENAMKRYLEGAALSESLGREFFLAESNTLEGAWAEGIAAAASWGAR
jgi:hypothetical protein